ncbi:amidohydrolase family protein [Vannielia litorea]|uniref:L-fuconolactonase n=1 Tax=Vannielia litorea TaxID=1217970 RepID=A0A1N6E1C6_9RHOB|nr:amidohydrolase family protein [Vannielia litorea]SIN76816.1 L-fuconolactonase [Vannielia litorea]
MRIDAHQHFWTLSRGDYPWPNESVAPIFRDFGPDDLAPLLAAAGIDRTILVQATDTVEETGFLLDLAAGADFVAGVVGWVDLTAPDAMATIDRLRADPALKGLRPMLQNIGATDWILQDAAAPALAHMEATGLRFDALIQPRHLPVIDTLAGRYPGLPIVIDHIAKPVMGGGAAPDAAWLEGIGRLAARANVWCKLSGMVTEAGPEWTDADLAPFAAHVLDAFGAGRVMFGSDWPVLTLASDYATWAQTADRLIAELPAPEQAEVRGGTAARFYGID